MNQDIAELLDDLNRAINDALWSSEEILGLLTVLEEAIGDFRISVDLLLPGVDGPKPSNTAQPRWTGDDLRFLRTLKLKH